jgi:hypothetical protein
MKPQKLNGIVAVIMGSAILFAFLTPGVTVASSDTGKVLKVKLNYSGAGPVDEQHRIYVFLFDSPDFTSGQVMPVGTASATAKDETLSFEALSQSKVYVAAVYDKSGTYDGQSGPPPSGSPAGMYSKTPGEPEAVNLPEGEPVEIELAFDDSYTVP